MLRGEGCGEVKRKTYDLNTSFGILFVKLIPKYFILFDSMVNGIVFLIFTLDCSLLLCRNKIDFHISILGPIALLYSFILIAF